MNKSERVKHTIEIHLGVRPETITPKARLIDDLGMDSLDAVELVMAAEEEFGFEVPDDVAERWITVQDAIDGIDALSKPCPKCGRS